MIVELAKLTALHLIDGGRVAVVRLAENRFAVVAPLEDAGGIIVVDADSGRIARLGDRRIVVCADLLNVSIGTARLRHVRDVDRAALIDIGNCASGILIDVTVIRSAVLRYKSLQFRMNYGGTTIVVSFCFTIACVAASRLVSLNRPWCAPKS